MRNTRKEAIVLVTICSIIVVVVFFESIVFRTPKQLPWISVDEIMNDPSAWVNRTVTVEGNFSGPVFFPPFEHSPWNYTLSSDDITVGVSLNTSVIAISGFDNFSGSTPVVIHGIVEKGEDVIENFTDRSLETKDVYYIAADRIDWVLTLVF